jgi:pentatricopeptide repeat protein
MQPNEVTWNTLLKVYANRSDLEGARAMIEEMRAAGVRAGKFTWTTLLNVYVNRSDVAGARAVMEEMHGAGFPPNEVTWNTLLKAYVNRSDVTGVRAVMEEMRAAGVHPDKVTWTLLLECHAKSAGDTLSSAEKVALQMEKNGFVLDRYAYSALIRCCFPSRAAAHPHNPSQAKHWFSLYVSGWRNRGPLDPGIACNFQRAVGYEAAADVCINLGLDPGSVLAANRHHKGHGQGGRVPSSGGRTFPPGRSKARAR